MDVDTAREILGVTREDDWAVVRERYRARIRLVHPDVAGGDPEAATRLNVAFAALLRDRDRPGRTMPTETPAQPARPARRVAHDVHLVGDDTLSVGAPPDETFRRLLQGLDLIGEVSYVDRSGPIAEAIVVLADGTSHSLVLTIQGRGASTEVFATLEALETVRSSRPTAVLRTLARFIPPPTS